MDNRGKGARIEEVIFVLVLVGVCCFAKRTKRIGITSRVSR